MSDATLFGPAPAAPAPTTPPRPTPAPARDVPREAGQRFTFGLVHRTQYRWVLGPFPADRWEEARDGLNAHRANAEDGDRAVTVENARTGYFVQWYEQHPDGWQLAKVTTRDAAPSPARDT